jgi:hypothetical protein
MKILNKFACISFILVLGCNEGGAIMASNSSSESGSSSSLTTLSSSSTVGGNVHVVSPTWGHVYTALIPGEYDLSYAQSCSANTLYVNKSTTGGSCAAIVGNIDISQMESATFTNGPTHITLLESCILSCPE